MGVLGPVLGSLTPRVNMLLLWLSLLLWLGSCWGEEMYGRDTAGTFFHSNAYLKRAIRGIEVHMSIFGTIAGFRLYDGKSWDNEVYCNSGTFVYKEILKPKERVVRIKGEYKLYLLSLTFITNQNRGIKFGERTGFKFDTLLVSARKVLFGMCGKCFIFGISSICFKWADPKELS